jgi:2,5-diketo-D-gluconate reductase B
MQGHTTLKGVRIPKIGCGTWELRGTVCAEIVAEALRLGYRHIDTAQGYDNETAVGDGIKASGVPRDHIFVTTKVRPDFAADGPLQRSAEDSLKRLRIDVIDLLLLHWPNPEGHCQSVERCQTPRIDPAHRGFELDDREA